MVVYFIEVGCVDVKIFDCLIVVWNIRSSSDKSFIWILGLREVFESIDFLLKVYVNVKIIFGGFGFVNKLCLISYLFEVMYVVMVVEVIGFVLKVGIDVDEIYKIIINVVGNLFVYE